MTKFYVKNKHVKLAADTAIWFKLDVDGSLGYKATII